MSSITQLHADIENRVKAIRDSHPDGYADADALDSTYAASRLLNTSPDLGNHSWLNTVRRQSISLVT